MLAKGTVPPSLPPLRFCWKKWINYSTSKEEEKKSESFPSVASVPSLSLPWGHRLTWRVQLREGTAHTQLSPVLPATGEADSTTPCMHEQRETAQGLKLGGCQDPCATCLSYVLQASFISNKVSLWSPPLWVCVYLSIGSKFERRRKIKLLNLSKNHTFNQI